MHTQAFTTHPVRPYESLFSLLDTYLPALQEKTVVAITSKVISLCQGRVVHREQVSSKYELIQREADAFLEERQSRHNVHLTITHRILIPSAGIDESNGNGLYILYPEDIPQTATLVWEHLRRKHQLQHIGVVFTDSHTTPLRRGVTGIGIGWCGFAPLYTYIGKPDVFGRTLQMTQVNVVDALAAAAVFVMGEGAEQTPLACIKEAPHLAFLDRPPTEEERNHLSIPLEEDIYFPVLKNAKWIWRKNNELSIK